MSLHEDIEKRFIEAMKAKDAETLSVLRNLRSALKNFQIEKTAKDLTDEMVVEVTGREVKKLKDAQADFEKAGRADLAEANRREIGIIAAWLPEQLTAEEVKETVRALAAELGLSKPAAFGRLMGESMKRLKGRADGNAVGAAVKEVLST